MAFKISAQTVGKAFIEQYYTVLKRAPASLFHFYVLESSKVARLVNGVMHSYTVAEASSEGMLAMGGGQDITLNSVESYDSHNGGVLVIVSGYLPRHDGFQYRFNQTFFLAPQEKGYDVVNDIFKIDESGHLMSYAGPSVVSNSKEQGPQTSVEAEYVKEEQFLVPNLKEVTREDYVPSQVDVDELTSERNEDVSSTAQVNADISTAQVNTYDAKTLVVEVLKAVSVPIATTSPATVAANTSRSVDKATATSTVSPNSLESVARPISPATVPTSVQQPVAATTAAPITTMSSCLHPVAEATASTTTPAAAPTTTNTETPTTKSYASVVMSASPAPPKVVAPAPKKKLPAPAPKKNLAPSASKPASTNVVSSTTINTQHEEAAARSIYVRNLPPNITNQDVADVFGIYGRIMPYPHGINIRRNYEQGFAYAFVEFEELTSAEAAKKASAMCLGNRRWVYIEAKKTPGGVVKENGNSRNGPSYNKVKGDVSPRPSGRGLSSKPNGGRDANYFRPMGGKAYVIKGSVNPGAYSSGNGDARANFNSGSSAMDGSAAPKAASNTNGGIGNSRNTASKRLF